MADNTDVLLKLYEEQCNQGRNCESQRSIVTNLIFTVSFGIIGLLVQKDFIPESLPLAFLIIVLGIYGGIMSAKLYERWQFHMTRARYYRRRIEELNPDTQVEQLTMKSNDEHNQQHSIFSKIRIHWIWVTLYIFIIMTGIASVIFIVTR